MIEVLKFEGVWCGQCKMADIAMKHFSHPVTKVDSDMNLDMVSKYNIMSLPTYIILKDSVMIGRVDGYSANLMGRILEIIENA